MQSFHNRTLLTPPSHTSETIAERSGSPGPQITLSPFYHSAVNAVTEPNRLVFCSRYLIIRWSPHLGGTGLQILLFLRAHCFHDRRTGECRNQWQVSRAEIAHSVGVSEATIKRELAHNTVLRQFVQPQQEYRLSGGRGGVRRDANSYRVAMDDPLHPDDWHRVEAYVREAEARTEKQGANLDIGCNVLAAKQRAKLQVEDGKHADQVSTPRSNRAFDWPAPGQIDPAQANQKPGVNLTHKEVTLGVKLIVPMGQIDPTKEERYSEKETTESTLNVQEEAINFVAPLDNSRNGKPLSQCSKNLRATILDNLTTAIINELGDIGSEKRHRQLLDICERNGLDELAKKALLATRRRLAQEQEQGVLEKPGAYYQKILVGLLEDHQVFVPPAGSKDEQAEIRRLARQSLEQATQAET